MGSSFNCMFSQHCVRRVSSLGGTSGHDGFDLGLGFARLKGGTDDGVRDVLRGLSLEHIGGGLETELLSKSNKLAKLLSLVDKAPGDLCTAENLLARLLHFAANFKVIDRSVRLINIIGMRLFLILVTLSIIRNSIAIACW